MELINYNFLLQKSEATDVKYKGWFAYLQSTWSMIRSSSLLNPPAYSAMVFNNLHMYTFDGQYYKHPGNYHALIIWYMKHNA